MRSILTAALLAGMCSTALAQDCRFFNHSGQSIDYRPLEGEVLVDTVTDGVVRCAFIGGGDGNGYPLACDDGPRELVTGMSEPHKPFVDILVLDNIFFWLRCEETI